MATEDKDIPPLEDLTDAFEKFSAISGANSNPLCSSKTPSMQKSNQGKVTTSAELLNLEKTQTSPTPAQPVKKKPAGSFGGLKKGFLSVGGKAGSAEVKGQGSRTHDELEFVKPVTSGEEKYRFDEVQEAMKLSESFAQNKDQWLTEDLLNRIQSDPSLCAQLANPATLQAMQEMQTNPVAATERYKNNPEMSLFLQQFSSILGDHFNSLADKQTKQQSAVVETHSPGGDSELRVVSSTDPRQQREAEDQRRVEEILGRSDIREILLDKDIQSLMEQLRTDPDKAQRKLVSADASLHAKLNMLIDAGLLQIQR